MNSIKILAVTSLLAFSTLGHGQEKPQINIVDVRGGGSGCPVDNQGKPVDWNITYSDVTKALVVDFASFLVNPEQKNSNCTLRIWIAVPQGKTAVTYFSSITGTADMSDEDYGIFAGRLTINGEEFPPVSYTVPSGMQDDWETDQAQAPAKVTAPCGGDLIKLEYKLGLSLFGDDSEIQVSSQSGKFGGVNIELKDCE